MKSSFTIRLLVVAIVFFPLTLQSQIWLDDEAIFNEANEYMEGDEFEEALPLFILLEKKGISNSNLSYLIGKCYLNIPGRKNKAIPHLEAAVENISAEYNNDFSTKKAPADAHLFLGMAYRIDQKFEHAIAQFDAFKEASTDSDAEALADYNISLCNNARVMLEFPNDSKIEEVETMSDHSVYNPLLLSDNNVFYMESRPFYDAIISGEKSVNKIINPVNLSPQLRSDGQHILLSTSSDGSKIILKAYDAEFGYELYLATKNIDGKWGKNKKLPKPINSPQNETFGAFSSDGKSLYFCSNRTGGFGGTDIFVSHANEDGSWSEPKNIGPKINSNFDESSVFLSADDNKIFFSSEGHLNMGGNDFFVSVKDENGEWAQPINLGSPVSTSDDDIFLSPTGAESVFYTFRPDPNSNDLNRIFKVTLDKKSLERKVLLNGKLNFGEEFPSKKVTYNINKDNIPFYSSKTSEDGSYSLLLTPGLYSIEYHYNDDIVASQKLNIDDNISIDELRLEAPVWQIDVPDTVILEQPLIIVIRPVLFGFDSYKINNQDNDYLDTIFKILQENHEMQISIVGYTDAIGNSAYNQQLSESRARAVKQYLLEKGLRSNRIITQGKGESEPVAINNNPDGSDNKIGRKYNRRVILNLIHSSTNIGIQIEDLVPDELKIK